ncbi:hypothetical protein R50073_31240 [Maricurvus nonylphenolicus]|uniref:DUF2889 domain-containing protein n=1 Tax=Maricurvus nonylphenolicus TaxID=1008307 RepID=UPI0036F1C39C
MLLFDYADESYGTGTFRRHIHIKATSSTCIKGYLEDEPHAFSVELQHDQSKITSIEATWVRHPTSTCPGAIDKLKELEGAPLSSNPLDIRAFSDSKSHCTHFFDLTALMITHAYNTNRSTKSSDIGTVFFYTMAITDEANGLSTARLNLNGKELQYWSMKHGTIESPSHLKGQNPMMGMTSWAKDKLSVQEISEVLCLQKAIFVATGRRFKLNELQGANCKEVGQPIGQCYAMRDGREEESIRIGKRIDFTNTPEDMLQFIDP